MAVDNTTLVTVRVTPSTDRISPSNFSNELVLADFTFKKNQMLVIQPNVITKDRKAGVQTGECVVITDDGCRSIHDAPDGFLRVGN